MSVQPSQVKQKTKHTTIRRKIKDWLYQNQDNVFELEQHIYSQDDVLVSNRYTNQSMHVDVVKRGHHHNMFLP